jgi:fatty-acyl-CoA synthase
MLVPINWRLAVPEQLFILQDASVKALFLEEAFASVIAPLAETLPDARVVGIEFSPAGGQSIEDLLTAGRG